MGFNLAFKGLKANNGECAVVREETQTKSINWTRLTLIKWIREAQSILRN